MKIKELLRKVVSSDASDLHLKVGLPPVLRINGQLARDTNIATITLEDMAQVVEELTTSEQLRGVKAGQELDYAYYLDGVGRFRLNICHQLGTPSIACRPIRSQIPTIEDLKLPPICKELALKHKGLIIVTGATGSGKSTTQAALVDYMNTNTKRNIITVEDPIEFVHKHNQCIFSQRQVGTDTKSFSVALRHALRQDPDVILIGEMRDLETMAIALTAAETGHLIITTLHTKSAAQAIDRFIDVFPPHQQQQIRVQLSTTLLGVLYQVLLPNTDNSGRVVAVEVMLGTGPVKALIREGKTYQLLNVIQTGSKYGMQTFDRALVDLYLKEQISHDEMMDQCVDREEIETLLNGCGTDQEIMNMNKITA